MFPWLPTYAMIKRTIAAIKLFTTIKGIGTERAQAGRRSDDTMQILLDQGDDIGDYVGVGVEEQ